MRIERKTGTDTTIHGISTASSNFKCGDSEKNKFEATKQAALETLREECRQFVKTGSGYCAALVDKNKDLVPPWLQKKLNEIKDDKAIADPLWYSINMMESTEFAVFASKLIANHPKVVIEIDPKTKRVSGVSGVEVLENDREKLEATSKDVDKYVRIRDRISGLKQILPEPKVRADSAQHEYSNFVQVVDSYTCGMLRDLDRKN